LKLSFFQGFAPLVLEPPEPPVPPPPERDPQIGTQDIFTDPRLGNAENPLFGIARMISEGGLLLGLRGFQLAV